MELTTTIGPFRQQQLCTHKCIHRAVRATPWSSSLAEGGRCCQRRASAAWSRPQGRHWEVGPPAIARELPRLRRRTAGTPARPRRLCLQSRPPGLAESRNSSAARTGAAARPAGAALRLTCCPAETGRDGSDGERQVGVASAGASPWLRRAWTTASACPGGRMGQRLGAIAPRSKLCCMLETACRVSYPSSRSGGLEPRVHPGARSGQARTQWRVGDRELEKLWKCFRIFHHARGHVGLRQDAVASQPPAALGPGARASSGDERTSRPPHPRRARGCCVAAQAARACPYPACRHRTGRSRGSRAGGAVPAGR